MQAAPANANHGFSRSDLYVSVCVLAVLGAALGPLTARSREPGERIGCVNNLRQLGVALLLYSSENNGIFPPRATGPSWPGKLQQYYKDLSILRCPHDTPLALPPGGPNPADTAARSYLLNSWNDYFQTTLDARSWDQYQAHAYPFGMPDSAIPHPNATIAFGEKVSTSVHFWMDSVWSIGDITDVEHGRHFRSKPPNVASGGSNYTMADGSVQFLKFGASFVPTNLWFVTELFRTNALGP